MDARNSLLLLALFVLFVGCASQVQLYDGPSRPNREVVRIKAREFTIKSVDGKAVEAWATVEILPGKHEIRVEWKGGANPGTVERRFLAPRGSAYYRGPSRTGVMRRYGEYFALIPFESKAGQVYETEWVEQGEAQQVPALKLVSGPK